MVAILAENAAEGRRDDAFADIRCGADEHHWPQPGIRHGCATILFGKCMVLECKLNSFGYSLMIKRVFLYSFLFYLRILVLPGLYVGWRHLEIDRLLIRLIFALVSTAIGFHIGVFISAVLQKPTRELQFYVIGQLLPATFIIIVYVIGWSSSHKKTTNNENNKFESPVQRPK
jgi:phage shock protein PspC (stress-responsive transcriptional regulator)